MKRFRPPPVIAHPVTFQVGEHVVVVSPQRSQWVVSVGGADGPGAFANVVEAWEAGVREADRLDRARGE